MTFVSSAGRPSKYRLNLVGDAAQSIAASSVTPRSNTSGRTTRTTTTNHMGGENEAQVQNHEVSTQEAQEAQTGNETCPTESEGGTCKSGITNTCGVDTPSYERRRRCNPYLPL